MIAALHLENECFFCNNSESYKYGLSCASKAVEMPPTNLPDPLVTYHNKPLSPLLLASIVMAPLLVHIFLFLVMFRIWRHYKYFSKLDHVPGKSSWTR